MKVGQEMTFRMDMKISDISGTEVPEVGDIVVLKDKDGDVQSWEIEEVHETHVRMVMHVVLELRA